MKTIKVVTTLVILLFTVQFSFAQTSVKEYSVANFEVNATCNHCKTTIETALDKTDGVQSAVLDLTSKIVNVKYDEKVVSEEDVAKVIQDAGYTTKVVDNTKTDKKQKGHKCNTPCNRKCN